MKTLLQFSFVSFCWFYLLLTFGSAIAQQPSPPAPPAFPKEAIGTLEFDTIFGKSRIGTGAFVTIKDGNHCYILTVRHLLGPNVDFHQAVAPQDVPHVVKGIHFYALDGTDRYLSVTGLVFHPTGDVNDNPLFDLAAYAIDNPPDQTLTLASTMPKNGESIWIVGHVRGGVPEGEIAHSATVVNNPSTWFHATWDNDNVDSYGASGAPVLNSAGEVVGIESGHSMWNGHKLAFIIPAPVILAAIKAATSP